MIFQKAVGLLSLFVGSMVQAAELEVLHWWTSGGEAASVEVLKKLLKESGHQWKDSPIIGGGGEKAATALKTRVSAGDPPSAVQMKGPEIHLWAKTGNLLNIDNVVKSGSWETKLPQAVMKAMQYKNQYYGIPVNVHRVNWMWVNAPLLQKLKLKVPQTWEEFFQVADAVKKAGFTAVAQGGQSWQEATLFEEVVLGVGGPQLYKEALMELKEASLKGPQMVKVFETMKKIKSYFDKDGHGRAWDATTKLVIEGKAAFQFMGDWAKGEFVAAKKQPDKDFICAPAPGTKNMFLFNIDSFILFKNKNAEIEKAQIKLAELITGETFQKEFNIRKGSIPAFPLTAENWKVFDSCAKASQEEFKAADQSGALLPSMAHRMAIEPHVVDAIYRSISQFLSNEMNAEEGAKQLAKAVAEVNE